MDIFWDSGANLGLCKGLRSWFEITLGLDRPIFLASYLTTSRARFGLFEFVRMPERPTLGSILGI